MTQAIEQINNIKAKVSGAIDKYGNSLTIRSPGVINKDAWGHSVKSGTSDVVTIGVTDNYIIANLKLTSAGRLKDKSSTVLLKGSESIGDDYTILIEGAEYNIMSIEPLRAADIVVAYQVVLGDK